MKKVIFQNLTDSINLANLITAIGIILTTWFNVLIWGGPTNPLLMFILALIIQFSDFLDGWVARQRGIITPLGGSLDKFRDKFYSCSVFIYFLKELWSGERLVIWLSFVKGLIILILIIESFLILVWIVGFAKRLDVSSHFAGKVKTTFYFIGIGWWFFFVLLESFFKRDFVAFLYGGLISLLFFGSIFGILSIVGYLQRYSSPSK